MRGAGLNSEQVLRKLNMWCVDGPPAGGPRLDHMMLSRRAIPVADLRSDDTLLNERVQRWDHIDAVI